MAMFTPDSIGLDKFCTERTLHIGSHIYQFMFFPKITHINPAKRSTPKKQLILLLRYQAKVHNLYTGATLNTRIHIERNNQPKTPTASTHQPRVLIFNFPYQKHFYGFDN
jgi:hypothetical protein